MDIDGTLWNTTGVVAKAWNKAIADCGFDAALVNASGLQKEFGKPMNVIADDLWPALSQGQKDLLMKQCCVREQEALKENQEDIAYPKVRQTIEALANKFKLYIVSNCQAGYIELTMEKNKIADYIENNVARWEYDRFYG